MYQNSYNCSFLFFTETSEKAYNNKKMACGLVIYFTLHTILSYRFNFLTVVIYRTKYSPQRVQQRCKDLLTRIKRLGINLHCTTNTNQDYRAKICRETVIQNRQNIRIPSVSPMNLVGKQVEIP